MFCVSPECLIYFAIAWVIIMLCASSGQDELANGPWMWLMFFNALILSPVAFAYGEVEVGIVCIMFSGLVIALGGIKITVAQIGDCCTSCGSTIWFYLVDCCVNTLPARNDSVTLQAGGYRGPNDHFLGVFYRQEQISNDRPTYKKRWGRQFLYHSNTAGAGAWLVGPDIGSTYTAWKAVSNAMVPGEIKAMWQTQSSDRGWYDVPSVMIARSDGFKAVEVRNMGKGHSVAMRAPPTAPTSIIMV